MALPTRGRWRMLHGRAGPGIVSDLAAPWPLGKLSSKSRLNHLEQILFTSVTPKVKIILNPLTQEITTVISF